VSRPKAFTLWASAETNYPTSIQPWSGSPVLGVGTPVADYFEPGKTLAAPYLNWALNEAGGAANAVLNYAGQISGTNWESPIDVYTAIGCAQTLTSGLYYNNIGNIVYNPYAGRWEVAAITGAGNVVMTSVDGKTWSRLGSNTLSSGFLTNGFHIPATAAGVLSVFIEHDNGKVACIGANGIIQEFAQTFVGSGSTTVVGGGYFQGVYIHWTGSTTTANVEVFYSATPNSGASAWTQSSNTPFNSAPNSINGASAQSATVLLLVPAGPAPSAYWTSTDGMAWTKQATTGFGTLTNFYWSTCTYDAADGVFVAVFNENTGGGQALVYTSPDAINWTLVMPTVAAPSLTSFCNGIVANGSEWIGIWAVNGLGRILVSSDLGLTWRYTRAAAVNSPVAATSAAAPFLPLLLQGTGNQFFVLNTTPTSSAGAGNGTYAVSQATGVMPAFSY
jgi:hypothetical protein